MRIQRFEAKDTQTALAMVKRDLGEDAVILATRSLPPENKGGKPRIEVVAAMDYDLEAIQAAAAPPAKGPEPAPSQTPAYGYQTVRRKPATDREKTAAPPPLETVSPAAEAEATSQPHLESHDLRLRFSELMRQGPKARPTPVQFRPEDIPLTQAKPAARRPDPVEVKQWRDQIVDTIQVAAPEAERPQGPALIALVGATGVGKTTTAAKLAAWYTLRQGQRVALLSMDCYRIGATDQLRTYAQIMRLPCEIVLRRQDLARALARHQDKDVVIIDTAGKSPYDDHHIQELRAWFAPCPAIEPHLVLSATAKKEDLQITLEAYGPLAARGLILTKLDETRAYAALCQQVAAAKLPVAFLTTGQRVPEDFLVASKDFLDTLFKQGWEPASARLAARP